MFKKIASFLMLGIFAIALVSCITAPTSSTSSTSSPLPERAERPDRTTSSPSSLSDSTDRPDMTTSSAPTIVVQPNQSPDDYQTYDIDIGALAKTDWFNYTITSSTIIDEYAGHTAPEGFTLYDVVIKFTSTYDEEVPMSLYDYRADWGSGDKDFGVPLLPADETMVPEEWTLPEGSKAEYHFVYEVPDFAEEISVVFLEEYADDTTGDFFITLIN